jgi:betaine reductase
MVFSARAVRPCRLADILTVRPTAVANASRRATARETARLLDLKGKKVIAIGERDGVQGQAIVMAARSAGAEVLLQITQCFV